MHLGDPARLGPIGPITIRTPSRCGYLVEIHDAADSSIAVRLFTIDDAEPIRDGRSGDGARLAWSASRRGLPLPKAPGWIGHPVLGRRNRLYEPLYSCLGRTARIVRHDRHGTGMSSWHIPPLTKAVDDGGIVLPAARESPEHCLSARP